ALSLWKIASDLRLLAMGPRAGIAEIALPETQPGSSIMPGKVNPVILESLTMVVARVVANRAVRGLTATDRGPALVEQGLMLATALVPEIGYDAVATLAKDAFKSGRTIRELAAERGIAADRLDELLD